LGDATVEGVPEADRCFCGDILSPKKSKRMFNSLRICSAADAKLFGAPCAGGVVLEMVFISICC
jgi:hypothetical protein